MQDVRQLVERVEREPQLPAGQGERFQGYGVMAAPFRSGHLLAMRRFAASSIGPGYTCVWYRSPAGRWTFWCDRPPMQACPRYFGSALGGAVETDILVDWDGPDNLQIVVPAVGLVWSMHLRQTTATRVLNRMAALMPEGWWRRPRILKLMGATAGRLLHAGRLGLEGQVPNGQHFVANPMRIWIIDRSDAVLAGESMGEPGPLPEQVRLGDFWIPQRGLFALGRAFFEVSDPQRHALLTTAPEAG